MLNNKKILIVEDEFLIALELIEQVISMRGSPIGPVAAVKDALSTLEEHDIDGAILDAMLVDRDITPVAIDVVQRAIPAVVYTGSGLPSELRELHPDLPVIMKPARAELVLERLVREMSKHSRGPSAQPG